LRQGLAEACQRDGFSLHVPPLELCTDNAAMIAACATQMLRRGRTSSLNASPDPNLPLV
ncbi:MAG: tRNA (adenosine(37)-N6)-threonylcarbamoyltransferase complex transferase subunit TsaD, partial [Actinobacteria bacterium]|nr:tRNA (adenosine(37)-N6)-threonylcarbamoyltransferase complex transferase subunit TsaD [Actinomycetota bacterium]